MRSYFYCLVILGNLVLFPFSHAQNVSSITSINSLCFEENFHSITTGNNTSSTGSNTEWEGNLNFPIVEKAYKAGGAIRLGTGNAIGSITSKILDDISGNTTLQFDVKGWTEVEGDIVVSLGGTTHTISYSATMSSSFESKTLHFSNVPINSTLIISTTRRRAFLDNIQLICNNFEGAHTDFYRSRQSGSWSDFQSWESSPTGMDGSFTPSYLYPNSQASQVLIQENHHIQLNSPNIEITHLEIEGTLEISGNTTYSVLGEEDFEVRVKSGGIFLVNSNGPPPNFQAQGLIETGGKLVAGPQMGGGTAFGNRYLGINTGFFSFEDQSIVEWDNPYTVLGSTTTIDKDFFRRTSEEAIPIFRILTTPGFEFGSDENNILNCVLELVEPAQFGFRFSGEKTILGGIQGNGLVRQNEDSGNLLVGNSSHQPILDGNLNLEIQDYKLKFPNGVEIKENAEINIFTTANVQNHRIHRMGGDIHIYGSLDIHNLRIENAQAGGVYVYGGGKIRTRHTEGLFGPNTAIVQYASGKLNLLEGSAVEFYADEPQAISSLMNYFHLIFSGNGTKNPNSAIGVHTNGSVQIYDNPVVNFSHHNLASTTANNTNFIMEGGRLIIGTGGTQPNMNGNYSLSGGIIEFTGNSEIQIRVGNNFNPKLYQNIEISGTNVKAGTSDESGLSFHPNGSFILKNNGLFKVPNLNGIIGTSTSALKNVENLSHIELEFHSTIEYNRNDGNPQTISIVDNGYGNLLLTGSSPKTQNGPYLMVNNSTQVHLSEMIIPSSPEDELPYVLESKLGMENIGGSIVFQNNAVLLQDAGASNLGNIELKRQAIVPDIQYNFWSSPISNQPLYELYPDIPPNRVMIYNTLTDYYTILPTSTHPLSEFGKGYSIKGSITMQPHVEASFIGIPHNESFIPSDNKISLSTVGNRYNLIGNPFPSNLDLVKVFQENASQFHDGEDETPSFLFWDNTDNDDLIQQGSSYVNQNFALFNLSSELGVPAPRFGSAGKTPNGIVRPGQGFLMKASETASELNMTNEMRTYEIERNNLIAPYYRNDTDLQRNYFYLNFTPPSGMVQVLAIGYFSEAEDSFERFDSYVLNELSSENFYSLSSDEKKLAIQGRKAPILFWDEVPLGIKSAQDGKFKIGIQDFKGIFEEWNLFLWDKEKQLFHSLKDSDYEFEGNAGETIHRFSIVYSLQKPNSLKLVGKRNQLKMGQNETQILLESTFEKILSVEISDLNGKKIFKNNQVESKELKIPKFHFQKGIHFVQVITISGKSSHKIILD
jgi:hypothetical protein